MAVELTEVQKSTELIQDLLLKEIYAVAKSHAVFKGGTALRKVHELDRFSEDLDFDLDIDNLVDIDEALESFDKKVAPITNDFESERLFTKSQVVYWLTIKHPEAAEPIGTKIDILFDKPLLAAQFALMDCEGRKFSGYIMDKREIMAEKIAAIYDEKRNKPRDLYDVMFLIGKGVGVDQMLVYEKLKKAKKKYAFKTFENRVESLGKTWQADLEPLVPALPPFDTAKKRVIDFFRLLPF